MNTAISECPGCKLMLPNHNLAAHDRFNATGECYELYGELSVYNIERAELTFIHQLAVDAYSAQHSGDATKNITTVFSLVGLCLFNEHRFTGRQVQVAHMNLSKQSIKWPQLVPPIQAWDINVQDVIIANPGDARDKMIKLWSNSVWKNWENQHEWIRKMCLKLL